MASISEKISLIFLIFSILISSSFNATVVEDLAKSSLPKDFDITLKNICDQNPPLRHCTYTKDDLNDIFKFTIVSSHLCIESKNTNCNESFTKIDLKNRPKIVPLYLSYDFFWKYCPLSVMSIDLSYNSLQGSLPMNVFNCTQIRGLDLSFNLFTGDVPVEIFTSLTNLAFLNLSYNYFDDRNGISDSEYFKRFNGSSFISSGIDMSHKKKHKIFGLVVLVGFPIFVVLVLVCFGWLCFKRPNFLPKFLQKKYRFTKKMIEAATSKFSKKNLVVKGEGVKIYKGTLRDGTMVRIETHFDNISKKDRQRFVDECKVLVQLRHRNLVHVIGWCNNRKVRAIVAEWPEGGNVETWLLELAPSWKHRLKVLIGVVEGMCYLQEQWPNVGFDLRTNRVLLSGNLEPLISKLKVGVRNSHTQNIHKFGVFLLKMITNMRPIEEFQTGEAGFIEEVRKYYPGSLHNVIDKRMTLSENMVNQAANGIGLGLMCTDPSTSKYPSLNQIFNMLARAYQSCLVSVSPDRRRTHGDGHRGHGHGASKSTDNFMYL